MTWYCKILQRTYAHIAAAAVFGIFAASAALAQPNIIIRDCPSDNGSEPDNNCYTMCVSDDIWIRQNNDNGTVHQSPNGGATNYVYVRLTNINSQTLNSGTLHVYFAKASMGLNWPSNWNNSLPYGDEIGSKIVQVITGNTSMVIEIPWQNTPDPTMFNDPDARHFCLLARFISDEDPMTFSEGAALEPNVRNNNNIAWKNISILNPVNPRGAVDVANASETAKRAALRFDIGDAQGWALLDRLGMHIRVELGAELTAIWEAGGRHGEGFVVEAGALRIIAPNARIGGLVLGAGTRYTMHVAVQYGAEDPAFAGEIVRWNATQSDEETGEVIGGEGYDIVLPGGNDANGKVMILPPKHNELSSTFSLSTYPNPISSMATISYALPADTRVTLAIFDASGRLVQEIVSNVDNTAGNYEAVWDGTAADGTKMPSGTYICRLSTPLGSTEQQIKITR